MNNVTVKQMQEHFLAEELVTILTSAWQAQLPTLPTPDTAQMLRWLRIHRYDVEPVLHGIQCAATKLRYQPDCFHDPEHHIQYISACANRFRRPPAPVEAQKRAA